MMREPQAGEAEILHGQVVAIDAMGTMGAQGITVRLEALSQGCGACAHAGACGIGRLAGLRQPRDSGRDIDIPTASEGVRLGDRVCLGAPRAGLPLLALLGYVFPVFAMLLGAALGQFLGGDVFPALLAIAAFLAALLLVRRIVARWPAFFVPSVLPVARFSRIPAFFDTKASS
jgi:sigma-E factor negative regulatory protein RseC